MPDLLGAVAANPPRVFVIQTRGPLIARDIDLLRVLAAQTTLRVSFSITTDSDNIRRIFEPGCAPISERWKTVAALQSAGIETSVAIAPILPCDPAAIIERAAALTRGPIIADPFHVRAVKRSGATTRDAAIAICARHSWNEWLDPAFQRSILDRMAALAGEKGRKFGYGPAGFGLLTGAGNIA
jgi:DNA repair photolyase